MGLSYDQIVPAEYQNELIQLGEATSQTYWRVGDIGNHVYLEAMQSALPVTKMDVQAAVGFFFKVSGRTVRYYADVASFYPAGFCCVCDKQLADPPQEMQDQCRPGHWCWTCEEPSTDWRERYMDVLSFQHYAYAMQFRDGNKWQGVLEQAAYGGYGERPLSVDVIAGKNRPPEPEPPELFPEQVDLIGQRPETSKEVALVRNTQDMVVALEKMVENYEISRKVREYLEIAAGHLRAALYELSMNGGSEKGDDQGEDFVL